MNLYIDRDASLRMLERLRRRMVDCGDNLAAAERSRNNLPARMTMSGRVMRRATPDEVLAAIRDISQRAALEYKAAYYDFLVLDDALPDISS